MTEYLTVKQYDLRLNHIWENHGTPTFMDGDVAVGVICMGADSHNRLTVSILGDDGAVSVMCTREIELLAVSEDGLHVEIATLAD